MADCPIRMPCHLGFFNVALFSMVYMHQISNVKNILKKIWTIWQYFPKTAMDGDLTGIFFGENRTYQQEILKLHAKSKVIRKKRIKPVARSLSKPKNVFDALGIINIIRITLNRNEISKSMERTNQ